MIIHQVAQGTSAWLALRAGIPTASMFDSIITPGGKDGLPGKSTSADKYMQHLLAERVLGRPIDGFKSKWMELGNEYEDSAVASYEFANDCETERIGFVTTDDGLIGCSPDRFITGRPEGMLEAKAPSPATHVGYLLASMGASKEYKVQLQAELWVCEKEWVDIISYCPGFSDAVFRVCRDEQFIKGMAAYVREFSNRLEDIAADWKARGWIKDQVPEHPAPDSLGLTDEDIAALMAAKFPEGEGAL